MKLLLLDGTRLSLLESGRPIREEAFASPEEELPGLVERCLGRPGRLSRRDVTLCLGSPWIRVRNLPQLDSVPLKEVRELVAGRPDRFFRVMEKGWLTGVARLRPSGKWPGRTVAAAAPSRPVKLVDDTATALGWRLVEVHPARDPAASIDLRLPEQRDRQASSDRKRLGVALVMLTISLFVGPLADVLAIGHYEKRLRRIMAEQAPAVAAIRRAREEAFPHLRAVAIRDSVMVNRHMWLRGLTSIIGALPADAHLTSVSADSTVVRVEGHAREPLEVRAALDTLHWSEAPIRGASLWTGAGSGQARRPFTLELIVGSSR